MKPDQLNWGRAVLDTVLPLFRYMEALAPMKYVFPVVHINESFRHPPPKRISPWLLAQLIPAKNFPPKQGDIVWFLANRKWLPTHAVRVKTIDVTGAPDTRTYVVIETNALLLKSFTVYEHALYWHLEDLVELQFKAELRRRLDVS